MRVNFYSECIFNNLEIYKIKFVMVNLKDKMKTNTKHDMKQGKENEMKEEK